MFPVRLTHSEHGYAHAHDQKELEGLEVRGWKVQSEAEFLRIVASKGQPAPAPEVVSVEAVEQPRRGRPRKVA